MKCDSTKQTHSFVLHNFESSDQKAEKIFYYAEELITEYNLVFSRIGISSYNKYLNSDKLLFFQNGRKKLEKYGFDQIKSLSLIVNPDEKDLEAKYGFDYILNFALNMSHYLHTKYNNCYNFIQFDISNKYFDKNYNKLKITAKKFYQITNGKYGYCFLSPLLEDPPPVFYTHTNCNADPIPYYRTKNELWVDAIDYKNTYQDNQIRDIYPLNFLTDPHLDYRVNKDQTLRQFIESNSAHGKLEQLAEGFYCWEVAEDNCRLVRNKLGPSGIIVSYPANRLESHGFGMADAAWHKIIDPLTGGRRY